MPAHGKRRYPVPLFDGDLAAVRDEDAEVNLSPSTRPAEVAQRAPRHVHDGLFETDHTLLDEEQILQIV